MDADGGALEAVERAGSRETDTVEDGDRKYRCGADGGKDRVALMSHFRVQHDRRVFDVRCNDNNMQSETADFAPTLVSPSGELDIT